MGKKRWVKPRNRRSINDWEAESLDMGRIVNAQLAIETWSAGCEKRGDGTRTFLDTLKHEKYRILVGIGWKRTVKFYANPTAIDYSDNIPGHLAMHRPKDFPESS